MHLCAMHLISFTCNQLKDANIMANRKKKEKKQNHCMSMKGRTKREKKSRYEEEKNSWHKHKPYK